MASDLSDELDSLRLNDNQPRISTNSTSRRNYARGQNQRHSLRSKRAVTVDHDNREEKLRIVVLGATKVGKTCLCQQFLQEKFVADHKETVDEMYSAEIALVDRHLTLEILDTAGIDEFPVMRRLAIARGDAFLIVYAVNDVSSFAIAQQMRQLVLEIKSGVTSNSLPIIVVGNKSDIEVNLRTVNENDVKKVVCDQWRTEHIQTTCRDRESVLNAFNRLLNMANINIATNADGTRRLSDPNVSTQKEPRTTNKRQSCAQQ